MSSTASFSVHLISSHILDRVLDNARDDREEDLKWAIDGSEEPVEVVLMFVLLNAVKVVIFLWCILFLKLKEVYFILAFF